MQKNIVNGKTTEELVQRYQQGQTELFDDIAGRMNRLVGMFADKTEGTGESFDDLKNIMFMVLWKCCNDWNGKAKLSTMFWRYAQNKLRELRQKAHHQNQFANTYSASFDAMKEDTGFDISVEDCSYDCIEWHDLIDRLSLTANERRLINIRLNDDSLTKKEIAQLLGVDASAINYFEKSIAKKILAVA